MISRIADFIQDRNTGTVGEYTMCESGFVTLYASCYAAMTLHYLNVLEKYSKESRLQWAHYIGRWQNRDTGFFIGPELSKEELTSAKHDFEHLAMHLTAHVLPSLSLLGAAPKWPLSFAHQFLDKHALVAWLERRDWGKAWLEGNNLLFVAQFLLHLRDTERNKMAEESLGIFFGWLDARVDPDTGLWGTNGSCSSFLAMCGGYHQLLAYYYECREVKYKERLIDTVLSLQHEDGGFHPQGGGGACEDVDAADILVNMYKQCEYRRSDILLALKRLFKSIILKQMPDGGFVYRRDEPFVHMGIRKTASKANESNMFATWFRTHTLALIAEVLHDHSLLQFDWKFNDICSMGWHRPWPKRADHHPLI